MSDTPNIPTVDARNTGNSGAAIPLKPHPSAALTGLVVFRNGNLRLYFGTAVVSCERITLASEPDPPYAAYAVTQQTFRGPTPLTDDFGSSEIRRPLVGQKLKEIRAFNEGLAFEFEMHILLLNVDHIGLIQLNQQIVMGETAPGC